MEPRALLGLAVLGLYVVIGTVLAVYARRMGIKSSRDYYVAGYRMGSLLSALTYAATTYSAFMMVGLVGFTYLYGSGALGFELVYFVGTMFLLTILAPRAWRMARERKWISISDMLSDLYSSKLVGGVVAVVFLYALVPYMGAQVVGIATSVKGLLGGGEILGLDSYLFGVLVGGIVLITWVVVAGMWSVALTDALQGVLMILAAAGFLVWILDYTSRNPGLGEVSHTLASRGLLGITSFWKPVVFIGFTVPWFFFAVTNPQVVQRLFIPRDQRALSGMVKWFALFGLSYTVVVTVIGLVARGLTETGYLPSIEDKDMVTPTLLSIAPPLLSALVFTSIAAAAGSTVDSIALTVASSVVTGLYKPFSKKPSEAVEILVGRIIVVVLVLAASVIAIKKIGFIVALSVLSSAILLPLAPPTIYAWLHPEKAERASRAALASIVSGVSIATAAVLEYGVGALVKPLLGLPIPLWVLLVSTLSFILLPRTSSTRHPDHD